jgi:hypothetical protein
MSTDSQIAANQANALRSTGPRTAEGKAKARRNALKHGMTCEQENLSNTDEKLHEDRLERWTRAARPQNDMEVYQLESAVRATVNLDRCARNAKAEMDRRTSRAVGHWNGVQTKKLTRAIKFWTTQPANCVAQLETFTRGVEWLLERWEELAKALEANECWTIAEAWLAMRLMGKCPEMYLDSEVAAFRTLVIAARPDIDRDEAGKFRGLDTARLEPEARDALLNEKLPSREDAREGLWATFDAELERLEPIREKLWERKDGPALLEKLGLAAFDDSKSGVLRRRYESANHMDMHRCLKQLTEQRRQREARVEEDLELEEIALAEERAEIAKQTDKLMRDRDARLRNEAKSSATTDKPVSTSGNSEVKRPRDFPDRADYVKWLLGTKETTSESAPATEQPATGADEAQKPS